MSEKLTKDQDDALRQIASVTDWCHISIDRSGRAKRLAPARQQLAKKGLIEAMQGARRIWRATPAGRLALQGADHV